MIKVKPRWVVVEILKVLRPERFGNPDILTQPLPKIHKLAPVRTEGAVFAFKPRTLFFA